MSILSSRRDDDDFLPAGIAAQKRRGSGFAYILTVVIGVFLAAFVFWANQAVLDEVTRGEAEVIPSSRVQVIENLEGGIVEAMYVRNGDVVEAGQPLLRITNTQAASDYRGDYSRYLALVASTARLQAEIDGAEEFLVPQEVMDERPDLAEEQLSLFRARRAQLEDQLSVLQARAEQRRIEIAQLRDEDAQIRRSIGIAREELNMTQPLVERGVMPRTDLLRIQREMTTLEGDLQSVRSSIPRAEQALNEVQREMEQVRSQQRSEALRELAQQSADRNALREGLVAGRDRVDRTEVRSPVHGVVKDVKVTTLGGVIDPGQPIMEIVPLDDTLLVEAKIRPSDIAFLHPGQSATVRISAYDFSIYGGLQGEVEGISAGTIRDEDSQDRESYYRVFVRTEQAHLAGRSGEELPIIPGMTATVDILTGQKTVLDYLLKPILKAQQTALTER